MHLIPNSIKIPPLNMRSFMKMVILLFVLCLLLTTFFLTTRSSKQVLVLLGPPGSGKGTQAVLLQKKMELPQISTGDLFRDHQKRETPIGLKAKEYMAKGQLVPDEIVLDMLFDRISSPDCKKGFILDGFPRTIPQAEMLSQKLKNYQVKVIALEVPDADIIKRLSNRLVCESCNAIYHRIDLPPKIDGICDVDQGKLIQRADDREEVILKRLVVYHEQTEPVKEYYATKKLLVEIDATGGKDETLALIEKNVK